METFVLALAVSLLYLIGIYKLALRSRDGEDESEW